MRIWNHSIARAGAVSMVLGASLVAAAPGTLPRTAHAAGSDTIVMAYGSAPYRSIQPFRMITRAPRLCARPTSPWCA